MEDQAARHNAPGPDALVGKVLDGRFRVIERLGAGGMGTVYKAVQSPLDRLVALKILNPNYDSRRDPGFQRRFFLEASVTSRLKHPNTITVIDYGKTADGIYYIAMEFVEGVTLAQVLTTEGALPWNRVLHIAQQICRSLREAHKSGIIHRDLKPANVMICNEETDHDLVKVLDFGLVKSFLPEGPHAVAPEKGELTQAGVFLGSPQYMAPEQARNVADPRSDVYSLGVVMYQMLMGRPPFYAEQSIDVIVKHMKEPPPPFRIMRPDLDVPADVEALVLKCLEKDPNRRYQSMEELLDAIRNAALGSGLSGSFASSTRSSVHTPPPVTGVAISSSGSFRNVPTPSGPQRQPPGSGPRGAVTSDPHARRAPPPAAAAEAPTPPAQSAAIDISVDARDAARARKLLPLWIFLGSVLIGLVVVFFIARSSPPAPVVTPMGPEVSPPPVPAARPPIVTPPNPTPTPPAAAAGKVRFRIQSDPAGARVSLEGRDLGETPLEVDLPAGEGGSASAELTFTLEGYQRQTVTAAGTGPEVVLTQKLQKKPPPSKNNKTNKNATTPGYKDDPY